MLEQEHLSKISSNDLEYLKTFGGITKYSKNKNILVVKIIPCHSWPVNNLKSTTKTLDQFTQCVQS